MRVQLRTLQELQAVDAAKLAGEGGVGAGLGRRRQHLRRECKKLNTPAIHIAHSTLPCFCMHVCLPQWPRTTDSIMYNSNSDRGHSGQGHSTPSLFPPWSSLLFTLSLLYFPHLTQENGKVELVFVRKIFNMADSIVPYDRATAHALKRGAFRLLELMKQPLSTIAALGKHMHISETIT